ncbi:MAG: hypothetical protein NTW14_04850 [bacterium]|nr:hypothetical protein [bacterium]
MTLYDLEVVKAPSSVKAQRLISAVSGFGERDLKARLRNLPLVVKQAIPLFEAVAVERQLNILGISTRLVRVEVGAEPEPSPEPAPEVFVKPPPSRPKEDEIIEIPEAEIMVLPSFGHPEEKQSIKFKRKRALTVSASANWLLLIGSVVIIGLVCWYIVALSNRNSNEDEIKSYINQWQTTLQQQDLLLDNSFPPDRIFYKLDEIESKISHLLNLIKSQKRATELRSGFSQIQGKSGNMVMDLLFRKTLEDHGYPIHPMCLVDRGMVRGSSDLPEATLLRVQLFRPNELESVHFAARVLNGAFRLIIDPAMERNVYDAKATVAAYTQQPTEIQRWAERKFALTEACRDYLPGARSAISGLSGLTGSAAAAPGTKQESGDTGSPIKSSKTLTDPGNDTERAKELEKTLEAWTTTMQPAQQEKLTPESAVLKQIYNRLLDLEVRIDQLISLMESSIQQNIWIERREDVYGSFIDLRQEIEELNGIRTKKDNPLKLEEALHRNLGTKGYRNAQVLVVDSQKYPGNYNIEFEFDSGTRDDVFIAIAQTLKEELRGINLQIEQVSLKFQRKYFGWTLAQIRKGIDALDYPDGPRRCAALLYLSSSNLNTP